MLRTLRIGAGLGLALFIVTCTDRSPSGPGRHGASLLDFSALTQAAPGEPVIPMDSVRIVVRGSADLALLLDVTFALGALDSSGAADTLSIDVPLRTDPEPVTIAITATGAGVTWYTGTTTATLTNNQTTAPGPLTLIYVGPGAGADSVRIQTVSTRIVGGTGRTVTATVWGPAGLLTGVPVGYRSGSSAVATTAALSLNSATVTGAVPVRDSTWVYAETPTHLKDSIRVQVVPPPATLVAVSGSGQTGPINVPLPAPLAVQVRDQLNGGFLGQTVTWTVMAGSATLSSQTSLSDDTGYAFVTVTPTGSAPLTIQATAAGLTGSPLSFTATVGAASGVASTVVSPGLDTLLALTATVALTAEARDTANNPVAGSFGWVSRTPGVASVNGSGLVTAVANGATWVVATETGGTMDSARIVVQQQIATINVTPGTRSIYLPGTFDFTAAAVDGLGFAVAGAPAFTWSSTAPAVASVDSTGHVATLGLGTAQIRATAGAIIGVANVSVITPITRIVVAVDTVGATLPDTFTLTSLGLSRRYRAIAHDTLDAVMAGVSFTWASTNGSVAVIDSTTAVTANVTAAANGVTSINATAQGFTAAPGAALTVAQVLAAVELDPPANNPTATVAIAGTMGLVARGKDANNRYISGGSFTFASDTPAVATVGATTGLVTGVATGTTNVTAASGAITSNPLVVTVGSGGPAIISFGRDTLSVGRGSSASIPILLSKPSAAAPVTVNLAVADTFAFWSTPSVTIPAGATSANATLNGRNAGTTTVTALDGSGTGYAGDTAVVAVTANMQLAAGGYGINATDIVATQVQLSDPSPAGGTYVTFSYGTAGIAAISPDPAFIPAGQLAADIQIRGLAAGSTTITPTAIGVNGTASSFTAYAPILTPNTASLRLGAGQYESNVYVYAPTNTNVAIPVTLTSSDTSVVAVTPAVTIPGGSNYAYFTTTARATGSATITLSAAGWTASSPVTVTSTSPLLGICCGTTLFTTSPLLNVTVYAEDSVRTPHYRTNSLVVHLQSSDTTVMRVLDTVVTIAPGQSSTSAGRVIPGGSGGTAYVIATAGGHGPDSALYTVQGPPLAFSWGSNRIGAGQQDQNLYVYTPNNVASPLVVTIANPDSSILGVPTTVTIPTGINYAYFTVRGKAPGSDTLTATAPGFGPASASYVVTTPRLTACCGTTFNEFAPGTGLTVYATDSTGSGHIRSAPLSVSIVSTDPSVVAVDSSVVTIDSGTASNSRARVTPVGLGTARIIFSAAGHQVLDSLTFTVQVPLLQFSFTSALVGRRQHFGANSFYVYTPDSRATPVAVTITRKQGAVDSLSDTVLTIPAGINYAYFNAFGLANGTDTLIATAPGYRPDTAFITVTTPKLTNCCMPGTATTTNPPFGMTVYATDSVGNGHLTMDTVVIAAVASDTTVIRPTQPFFRILPNVSTASTAVTVTGPGTANITYADSAGTGYTPTTTGTITVTGPSLAFSNGSPMLGMRQRAGVNASYVYTTNNVATPLVVTLVSTDTQVARVPASVTILAGTNYAYFEVIAQDTVGTIQIQATATGYSGTSMNVQVTQGRFVLSTGTQLNTTSAPTGITVYAADANGTQHLTTENVTVNLLSSSPGVAAIDSTSVTILSGNSSVSTAKWSPGVVGTAQLQASDPRAALYKYNTGTVNVSVITPSLNFSWGTQSLGIGQYIDQYVYTPDNAAAPLTVALSHTGTPRVNTLFGGSPVSAVTIPAGISYEYFRIVGLSSGTDTLIGSISSPAHNPGAAYTAVGLGRIDPISNWPTTLVAGDSVLVTLYARDPTSGIRNVQSATAFTLAPNASVEFVSGGASSAVITVATIPAGQNFVQFYLKGVSAGNGSANVTATNYQPYSNTVTVIP